MGKHRFDTLHDLTDGFTIVGDVTVGVSVSHTGKHGFATLHDLTNAFPIVCDITVKC